MKLLFSLAFIICIVNGNAQTDTTVEWHSLARKNYSIQYPASWAIDTSGKMGAELFLFSGLENETDRFRENVNLVIQDLSGQDIDLIKYEEISKNQLKEMLAEGQMLESGIVHAGTKEYCRFTYIMTQGIFSLKITSYCYIKDDRAYLVTFSAEADKFEKFKKAGYRILDSFGLH